jgi:hypothetical protein
MLLVSERPVLAGPFDTGQRAKEELNLAWR